MTRVNRVKEVIDKYYKRAECGIFNTHGMFNDEMFTVYDEDGVIVDVCFAYEYFEVFGLTEEEFKEVEDYYESLGEK